MNDVLPEWEVSIAPHQHPSGLVVAAACTCGYQSRGYYGDGAAQRVTLAVMQHIRDVHNANAPLNQALVPRPEIDWTPYGWILLPGNDDWEPVTLPEWIMYERMAGFSAPAGMPATAGFSSEVATGRLQRPASQSVDMTRR